MKKQLFLVFAIIISHLAYCQAPVDFTVTSPNSNISWTGLSNKTVSWNVAGTSSTTPYVDILLSTDGGLTYTEMLAEKIPNDGSETILIPNIPGDQNRVMVRSNTDDNFFDISNNNFTIIEETGPTMAITMEGEQIIPVCRDTHQYISLQYQTYNEFGEYTFINTPPSSVPGINIYGTNPYATAFSTDLVLHINISSFTVPGIYPITLIASAESQTKLKTIYIEVLDAVLGNISNFYPVHNATEISPNVTFDWTSSVNNTYFIEIATDQEFNNIVDSALINESSYNSSQLVEDTLYFWRITAVAGSCERISPTIAFLTGTVPCPFFNSDDVQVDIPEEVSSVVTSSLYISENFTIQSLKVELNLNHTSIGDLAIKLRNPAGTEVLLLNNNCNDGTNINAIFSDEGEVLECESPIAISGEILPQNPLALFNGTGANGLWKLIVEDSTIGNGGIINSWAITICNNSPLQNHEVESKDFAIFPNPNNGNFTISLNSTSTHDIKVFVYDMSGRQLLNKTYANSGAFEQQISLENAATGVYLVSIQDGQNIVSKKIVVK